MICAVLIGILGTYIDICASSYRNISKVKKLKTNEERGWGGGGVETNLQTLKKEGRLGFKVKVSYFPMVRRHLINLAGCLIELLQVWATKKGNVSFVPDYSFGLIYMYMFEQFSGMTRK